MKLLYLLAFLFLGLRNLSAQPVANAGPDQTIYLTQTSSVTLNGSGSSGDSYEWTEVSTDYESGATITSPNSSVTTVTGLPQGTFYFQLAVTSGDETETDVVVVRVDYDTPPANSTLVTQTIWADMAYNANLRDDTTSCFSWTGDIRARAGNDPNAFIMEKDGTLGSSIDDYDGKYYSTLLDGHGCSGYGRSELIPARPNEGHVDISKTYVFEWKGYFPELLETPDDFVVIMQLHGDDDGSPVFAFRPTGGNLMFSDLDIGNVKSPICSLEDLVNQTHTIRMILKEGRAGEGNFVKVELDGVEKYYRNTGRVGRTFMNDWIKFASLYDPSNTIIDPDNHWRGKKFSLVTESFKVFTLNEDGSNTSPIAKAGSDQTITLPASSVDLSGSGSDADGSIDSYKWTKISGPSGSTIEDDGSASTTVSGLKKGTYEFQLEVTDDEGATGKSTVQITVKAASNEAPSADAGSDQTITLPASSAELAGSGSDDDGSIDSYKWTKISGPSGSTIEDDGSASTTVSGLKKGAYEFQLEVTDNGGATATSTVQITVKAASNKTPTADAGSDQTITLPISSVELAGNGSDSDGSIDSYEWTEISGPSGSTIKDEGSASTTVSDLEEGTYQFQLEVTDDEGATATSTVQITVKPAPNKAPLADAGSDQTINLPKNSVELTGSGSDSDGSIDSYKWTKISGPSGSTIEDAGSASTTVSDLKKGTYQFQLKVTDDQDATATDIITIQVNAAINQAPAVDAGSDQSITLPTNSITLSGSASDPDGTVESYLWIKIAGPSGEIINNVSSAYTTVDGLLEGNYTFALKVTDGQGSEASDTVQIKVNPEINLTPKAIAGANQTITLPTSSITLRGTGTDPDGTVDKYGWEKISGPDGDIIANPNSANTVVSGLKQGVYQYKLQVTDNKGSVDEDIIIIQVNAADNKAPSASAGTDQTITLPVNNTTLSGSGNDLDGTISSYVWTKLSGPSSYSISDSASAVTTISDLERGTYQFELKVTDDKGDMGADTINIKVNAASNQSPDADAGNDQILTLPTNDATLSGNGTDQDGAIVSYSWTKKSGPSGGTITDASSAYTTVSGLVQGDYIFELTVKDDQGATGINSVQIKVNPAVNQAPTADAGTDVAITLPTNSVILSGNGSDTDGTISSYFWKEAAGPDDAIITGISTASPKISGLSQGDYTFVLKVNDNQGATATDTIIIKVNAAINKIPTANAGPNQTITLPTNSAKLSGSGTDTDGSIDSYSWKEKSGPNSATITGSSSASPTINGLIQGDYSFELKVTDNKGATDVDIVHIKVKPAINKAPTANAGADKTITLPTNSAKLSGSGTDTDGTIDSYSWKQKTGPNSVTISGSSTATPTISGLIQGDYSFELKVTDNRGTPDVDIVQIKVNKAAANKAPTAKAGSNQTITLPANSVTLSGSGADTDGTINSYSWKEKTGPNSAVITGASTASPTISGLVQGDYSFELKVTDNKGATGTDTIHIKVNAPENKSPVAKAGSDQTVTLPTNSATLSGSGTDSDGKIISYSWKKVSGPSGGKISSPKTANTIVSELVQGVYQFEFQVTDNRGAIAKDVITITVKGTAATQEVTANRLPTANAGENITTVASNNVVELKGSGSDEDGSISSYSWRKVSGPSSGKIISANSANTKVEDLGEGNYEYELSVKDNRGGIGKDTVQVTVALERLAPEKLDRSLKVYPNPVRTVTNLEFNTGHNNTNVTIAVTDISGKTVYKEQFVSTSGKVKKTIDMSNLIKGVYVITVYFDGMVTNSIKVIRL